MTTIDRGRKVCMVISCALSLAIYAATSTAYGRWSPGVSFKREETNLAIRGFQPQMTASNCLTVKGTDARDKLICKTLWVAHGYKMTSISEVIVRKQNGTPSYEFKPIIEARDSTAARGANVVDCESAKLELFGIRKITYGSAPGFVAFESSHADRAAIQRACTVKDRNAKRGSKSLEENEAYILARDVQTSSFEVDIHTRALTVAGGDPAK